MKSKGALRLFAAPLVMVLRTILTINLVMLVPAIRAASCCQVNYTVINRRSGGSGASIPIQNASSSAWSSWTPPFSFLTGGQTVTQGRNRTFT